MATTPTRSRARQQPDETRNLILDTADRLLRERPFRELSVDEIMRPTGYGRTVFYRHFTGLPQLVLAVLTRAIPGLAAAQARFDELAEERISDEQVREVLRGVVEQWKAHGPLMRAMRDASVADAEIESLVSQTQRQMQARVADSFARRQAAGWSCGADPFLLAGALVAMNQRFLLSCFGDPDSTADVDAVTDALATVWSAVLHQRD
ncbi:MAG: TetR/AcrR family transcriptional regulator [Solirubrobacteraceae bacterium]|nr:TetR/AcrR family transcriptional regulator [Solirubrobacteraceae bacterium]